MTAAEIREQVSPMVIWMADAAIREARRAIYKNIRLGEKPLHAYNLPEVVTSGEVLFRMFYTFTNATKMALINMPEQMDGLSDALNMEPNYFDEFVKSLDEYQHRFSIPFEVALREADWILENL